MLFGFSLALPLLAGVYTPTWRPREADESLDLHLEAAGLLLSGTCRLVVEAEALPPTKPAPPWWMRCGWLDAPRSPEPGVSVTAYDLDDRYKRFDAAAAAAAAAASPARLVLSQSQSHTRAPASLRDREAEFEPWTAELVSSAKTAPSNISYAMPTRRVIWVKPDGQRAQHTVTLYKFPWPLWRFSEYETDVIRFPDPGSS